MGTGTGFLFFHNTCLSSTVLMLSDQTDKWPPALSRLYERCGTGNMITPTYVLSPGGFIEGRRCFIAGGTACYHSHIHANKC